MAKLYFKYGAMGSSKSAQALITKFNYEEKGMTVWLIKPATDTRDGYNIVKSRIGLFCEADIITDSDDIFEMFTGVKKNRNADVVIADECQFFTAEHIEQLRNIVDIYNVPVLCFGLRTDFRTKLFVGSRRLFELADSISEIKTICQCGKKAIVNARLNDAGITITHGSKILLGGNDTYVAMCHKCWKKSITESTPYTDNAAHRTTDISTLSKNTSTDLKQ